MSLWIQYYPRLAHTDVGITIFHDFQIDDTLKDTSVIEWYKDNKKIDPYDLHTPTVINPEYDDGTMSVAVDESRTGQPRYILHHNNSITIENVEDADVGSYTCKVDTGIGEPLGMYH